MKESVSLVWLKPLKDKKHVGVQQSETAGHQPIKEQDSDAWTQTGRQEKNTGQNRQTFNGDVWLKQREATGSRASMIKSHIFKNHDVFSVWLWINYSHTGKRRSHVVWITFQLDDSGPDLTLFVAKQPANQTGSSHMTPELQPHLCGSSLQLHLEWRQEVVVVSEVHELWCLKW